MPDKRPRLVMQPSRRTTVFLSLAFVVALTSSPPCFSESMGMGSKARRPTGTPYETIRHNIELAGRQGDTRDLERSIAEIDLEIALITPIETTTCWQLLKGAALVELGQADNAKAIFGMLADTCPVWEAFNNVAVLEAAEGQFGSAAGNLRRAIDCASKTGLLEARLPQGNLRKLRAEEERLSLTLTGFAKVCFKTTARVDCSLCSQD